MNMNTHKDELYTKPLTDLPKFKFDQSVVDVFPDMIKRSVPGYSTILSIVGQITSRYSKPSTYCYDLGCSLGAGIWAMRTHLSDETIKVIGIDNSESMIARCKEVMATSPSNIEVELICADLDDISFKPMSICLLNFTLQFLPLEQRTKLLKNIARAMEPGGALILSEKLAFDDTDHQALMTELHHSFKSSNGYSALEIAQKREAIENVLVPETFNAHHQRLLESGFSRANLCFQCFNFSSIIAIK